MHLYVWDRGEEFSLTTDLSYLKFRSAASLNSITKAVIPEGRQWTYKEKSKKKNLVRVLNNSSERGLSSSQLAELLWFLICPYVHMSPLTWISSLTKQAYDWSRLSRAFTMKREYRQADSKSQISHSRLVRTLASTLVTWLGYSGWIPPKPNHSSVFCQMGSELCWQSINSSQLVFLVPKSKWFWQHPLMPSQQKIYISYKCNFSALKYHSLSLITFNISFIWY